MGKFIAGSAAVLMLCMGSAGAGLAGEFEGMGKDAFPVFHNPPMLSARAAEEAGLIFPRDAVIGVRHKGEAKAYPISIMGIHELGNDSIGGRPIAITW